MMARRMILPASTGALMGLMALWMLHGYRTGTGGGAGLLFFLLHGIGLAAAVVVVTVGGHRGRVWRARLARHRPSARHAGVMLASAAATAGILHLIHGGP